MRSLSTSIRLDSSNKFMKNQYFYCKCDIKHTSIVYIFYSELHVQIQILEFNILVIFFDAINLKKKIEMCYSACDHEENPKSAVL